MAIGPNASGSCTCHGGARSNTSLSCPIHSYQPQVIWVGGGVIPTIPPLPDTIHDHDQGLRPQEANLVNRIVILEMQVAELLKRVRANQKEDMLEDLCRIEEELR